jgi:hypothetical protein
LNLWCNIREGLRRTASLLGRVVDSGRSAEHHVAVVVWKVLHIASMFLGVTLLFAYEIVFHRAAHAGRKEAIAALGEQRALVEGAGVAVVLLGIVFGLVTAWTGGFDLTAPWLVIAYVLVAILIGLGAGPESAYAKRLTEAANGEAAAFEAARRDPRRNLGWVSGILYGLVVVDMVAKPFS